MNTHRSVSLEIALCERNDKVDVHWVLKESFGSFSAVVSVKIILDEDIAFEFIPGLGSDSYFCASTNDFRVPSP